MTPDQAKAAAEKAASGKATAVELSEDNGFVVYDVTVAGPKVPVDVIVDAGSGAVLAQETDAEGGNDANEGPETADANDGSTGTGTTPAPVSSPATAG